MPVSAVAERDRAARHLQLLTETIAAVNSTLDLAEVFAQIASKVAQAMSTDACFVYLYDEPSGMLELRATHGARFDDPAHRPRMAPGEGITGVAAASMRPVVIDRAAHLDPRFKSFPNLPEDEYESILAVPVLARDKLAGALNVRTRAPRVFDPDEIALLSAIAGQVGQAIENAKLYERSQQRVVELEALADIGRTLSGSLYLDDALRGIASRTVHALNADGCAVVLRNDDEMSVGFREGETGSDADLIAIAEAAPGQGETFLAQPLQWKQRTTGALVVLSDSPRSWSPEERSLFDHHRSRGQCCGCQRPGGAARPAGSGDPPPGQEQPADGGLAVAIAGAVRPTTRRLPRHFARVSTGSSRSPRCTIC